MHHSVDTGCTPADLIDLHRGWDVSSTGAHKEMRGFQIGLPKTSKNVMKSMLGLVRRLRAKPRHAFNTTKIAKCIFQLWSRPKCVATGIPESLHHRKQGCRAHQDGVFNL